MESYLRDEIASPRYESEKVVYVTEPMADEIDLGDLIRKLIGQWKFIALVLVVGLMVSVTGSFYLTRSHLVEAFVRLPNVNELGDISDQRLLEVSTEIALERFLDQLTLQKNQVAVFEESLLFHSLSEESQLTPAQIFSGIRRKLEVNRIKHSYYELNKTEKTPLKEVSISLASSKPELAAEYIQTLVEKAEKEALSGIFDDIAAIKDSRIKDINDQLHYLTLAADASRLAEIKRLEEINREMTAGLRMQINLKIGVARKNRENQIIRVAEAFATAQVLNIVDPVTWDDLRSSRDSSQIINEFGGTDKSAPHYFQGTRILQAELNRLKLREDDKPFVNGLTDLEKKINELDNDPKIAALKARQDDTIYIEKFDELQRELSQLIQVPTRFDNVQLAVVSQQVVINPEPTRNPYLIILVGTFLSGFLGLFLALMRTSLSKKETLKIAA